MFGEALATKTLQQSRSADAFYSIAKKKQIRKKHHEELPQHFPGQPVLVATQALRTNLCARVETQWGDKLLVVGSSQQLGAWQPEQTSVVLTTSKDAYPYWSCAVELELPADGSTLEYKLVLVRASCVHGHGEGKRQLMAPVVEWELLPENRRLAPHIHHGSKAALVAICWGEPGASIQWRWEW